jgi:hypothetical protein
MAQDRTGLLIIRAYTEAASTSPLRAEIRLTTDVSIGFERSVTLAQPDTVTAIVRSWLEDFLSTARR